MKKIIVTALIDNKIGTDIFLESETLISAIEEIGKKTIYKNFRIIGVRYANEREEILFENSNTNKCSVCGEKFKNDSKGSLNVMKEGLKSELKHIDIILKEIKEFRMIFKHQYLPCNIRSTQHIFWNKYNNIFSTKRVLTISTDGFIKIRDFEVVLSSFMENSSFNKPNRIYEAVNESKLWNQILLDFRHFFNVTCDYNF